MDDLNLIEDKAHAFIEESKDVDSLARAANILRDVDEQRKIRAELNTAEQDADRAASQRKSDNVRFWTATLLPTLAFVVTAGTFLAQIYQGRTAAKSQEDSQWRSALEKIVPGPQSGPVGVLEMQSFFHSPQYSKQSRSVAATLLSGVGDTNLFDFVFFDLVENTKEQDQRELITLARALSRQLQEQYSKRKQVTVLPDSSYAHFLSNPEDFYGEDDDNDQSKLEAEIDVEEWNLDSVCRGLINLWRDPKFHAKLSKQDLTGITFYTTGDATGKGGDYGGVDFRGAELRGAAFYGKCTLIGAKFDSPKPEDHCEHPKSP